MHLIKNSIREILIFLHLDLTTNLKYDRLTREIIKKYIQPTDNCIDVGCHKGEILDLMLQNAPAGSHFGFEPIPYLFNDLKLKYAGQAEILPFALSDSNGETTFELVKNAPAFSGLKTREYNVKNPEVEQIRVQVKTLDSLLGSSAVVQFIKIDVEGGEFGVLKGAKTLLQLNKPIVLFEFGKAACSHYGTKALDIYDFLVNEIGLNIYTLQTFTKDKKALNASEFENHFETETEYYFVACNPKLN